MHSELFTLGGTSRAMSGEAQAATDPDRPDDDLHRGLEQEVEELERRRALLFLAGLPPDEAPFGGNKHRVHRIYGARARNQNAKRGIKTQLAKNTSVTSMKKDGLSRSTSGPRFDATRGTSFKEKMSSK